jgi:hypothetical protein
MKVRLCEFNLDGLFLSQDELSGMIVLQLDDYEPVNFHFRGLPLSRTACGTVCLLPHDDDVRELKGPATVTVLSPVSSQGYKVSHMVTT